MSTALGLLGGTFDPVHLAHLRLAEEAGQKLGLDEICWIPSGNPGHRPPPQASAGQRLAMLKLAIDGNPRFRIDEHELHSPEPTYTVNTLKRLRLEFGTARPLALIIGADQFMAFASWRQWEDILDLCHLAVAERSGHPVDATLLPPTLQEQLAKRQSAEIGLEGAGRIVRFAMTPLDISATAIRAAFRAGSNPRYLLPEAVLAYIELQSLYRKSTH